MSNKHIERASWDESIEDFPQTPWRAILLLICCALVTALIVVEYVVGADDFIYWVAGLVS